MSPAANKSISAVVRSFPETVSFIPSCSRFVTDLSAECPHRMSKASYGFEGRISTGHLSIHPFLLRVRGWMDGDLPSTTTPPFPSIPQPLGNVEWKENGADAGQGSHSIRSGGGGLVRAGDSAIHTRGHARDPAVGGPGMRSRKADVIAPAGPHGWASLPSSCPTPKK